MATGRRNQLTRQVGEHLVVAELGRRGIIATPFAGNVPDIDLLAVGPTGKAVPIQVKAINGGSWQFDAKKFLKIDFDGAVQRANGLLPLSDPDLLCIFVLLAPGEERSDRFFIFRWQEIQRLCAERYGKEYRRPRNPASTHLGVRPTQLEGFEENWKLVEDETL